MAQSVFGLTPHVVIGDFDSLSASEIAALEAKNVTLMRYPPEKDETDLELALKWVVAQGVSHIDIIGASGQRVDQSLGNIYLLALPELIDHHVCIVADNQRVFLLRAGSHTIHGGRDDTVSLLPLHGDVTNITTHNLYYPLNGESLYFGPARGMSNVMLADTAQISFDSGLLLVVHTIGEPL